MELDESEKPLFAHNDVSLVNTPEWQATQVFYTNEPPNAEESDHITAVEFSRDGEHLAVGDKGGRIWIYSTNDGRNRCKPKPFSLSVNGDMDNSNSNDTDEKASEADAGNASASAIDRGLVYDFYGQFQSHQPEFDYLKSLEIEEKINCISWSRCANNSLSLLACNDKTIKLWKVFEKSMYRHSGNSFHKKYKTEYQLSMNENIEFHGFANVELPVIECDDVITAAISRRVYQNGHKFHIHSLDVNADCETFISADDLHINLWHFDSPSSFFNLCDLKPESMENLTNTISKAILHPQHCNVMAYTTTQSQICLCDMRQNCQISGHSLQFNKVFEYQQPLMSRDFFTDMAGYLSGVAFSKDGETIIVRDYFNMYVWDIRYNARPRKIIPIHPYFSTDMKNLYESDLIFDKFSVISSPNCIQSATGTYNNSFFVSNFQTMRMEKCVLNANRVIAWQNKMKKKEKREKKRARKRLKHNKHKNKREAKNAANTNNNHSTSPNHSAALVAAEDDDTMMDSGGVRLNLHDNNHNKESVDEHNEHMPVPVPVPVPVSVSKSPMMEAAVDAAEERSVAPPWLTESYFQKGNFDQKVKHLSWHTNKDVIAAASGPSLFIFQKFKTKS